MKLFIILSLIFSQVVSASIQGSSLEQRHQDLIVKEIRFNCGNLKNLEEISNKIELIYVDQGIIDKDFTTHIRGTHQIDQGMFDVYQIHVTSHFGDHYDHSTGNWGSYSVSKVNCVQDFM